MTFLCVYAQRFGKEVSDGLMYCDRKYITEHTKCDLEAWLRKLLQSWNVVDDMIKIIIKLEEKAKRDRQRKTTIEATQIPNSRNGGEMYEMRFKNFFGFEISNQLRILFEMFVLKNLFLRQSKRTDSIKFVRTILLSMDPMLVSTCLQKSF